MSDAAARVLETIDAGLQSSTEPSYGTDRDTSACARCQTREPAEGGDLCPGCRAWLLGDSDDDPQDAPREVTLEPDLEPDLLSPLLAFALPDARQLAADVRQAMDERAGEVGDELWADEVHPAGGDFGSRHYAQWHVAMDVWAADDPAQMMRATWADLGRALLEHLVAQEVPLGGGLTLRRMEQEEARFAAMCQLIYLPPTPDTLLVRTVWHDHPPRNSGWPEMLLFDRDGRHVTTRGEHPSDIGDVYYRPVPLTTWTPGDYGRIEHELEVEEYRRVAVLPRRRQHIYRRSR